MCIPEHCGLHMSKCSHPLEYPAESRLASLSVGQWQALQAGSGGGGGGGGSGG